MMPMVSCDDVAPLSLFPPAEIVDVPERPLVRLDGPPNPAAPRPVVVDVPAAESLEPVLAVVVVPNDAKGDVEEVPNSPPGFEVPNPLNIDPGFGGEVKGLEKVVVVGLDPAGGSAKENPILVAGLPKLGGGSAKEKEELPRVEFEVMGAVGSLAPKPNVKDPAAAVVIDPGG